MVEGSGSVAVSPTNGSGSGGPTNFGILWMRIRIRIPNTEKLYFPVGKKEDWTSLAAGILILKILSKVEQLLLRSQKLTKGRKMLKRCGGRQCCYLLLGFRFKIYTNSYELPWSKGLVSTFGS
jgi:hypothetical protein